MLPYRPQKSDSFSVFALALFVAISLSLEGCLSRKEMHELRRTAIVLYPLAKMGDAINAVGWGARSLALTPAGMITERRTMSETLTDDQLKFLQDIAIEVPPSAIVVRENMGFGMGK